MTDELEQKQEAAELNKSIDQGHALLKVIDFGLQISQFLQGEIGQRLLADSEMERSELVEEMIKLDPDDEDDRARMRGVRSRVAVLDHWQEYFARYIEEGKAAETELQDGGEIPSDE